VHISVRAVGHDGRRLAPGPADLRQWRERFARELRRLGVEAEATPRQARGIVPKSRRSALYNSEARGVEPRIRAAEKREAKKSVQSPPAIQPWEHRIQARQEAIRTAYLDHAALLASGDAEDQRLARDIQRFVVELPVPLTRRQAIAVELRRVLDQHPGRGPRPEREIEPDLHRANPAPQPKPAGRSEPDDAPSHKNESPGRSRSR
jgi:hypothetical protein